MDKKNGQNYIFFNAQRNYLYKLCVCSLFTWPDVYLCTLMSVHKTCSTLVTQWNIYKCPLTITLFIMLRAYGNNNYWRECYSRPCSTDVQTNVTDCYSWITLLEMFVVNVKLVSSPIQGWNVMSICNTNFIDLLAILQYEQSSIHRI